MYRRLDDDAPAQKGDLYVAKEMSYYREVQPDEKLETPVPIEDGGPAFPTDSDAYNGTGLCGMTLRQYAAIKLRVPQSGLDWLDDMIRESQRNEFAVQALAGYLACPDTCESWTHRVMAVQSYLQADQMLQAQKGGEA